MRIGLLILVLVFCSKAFATEYYVSTSGSNKNNGRSVGKSWRTISHAAKVVKAGDIVWIKAGDYGRENVRIKIKGTESKRVSFIGYKD